MREQNGSAVSSAQARRGKRKLKTLQNSFGRKTTIKVCVCVCVCVCCPAQTMTDGRLNHYSK